MNIGDSIASFSNLYKKGLIKKEQFEAKVIDILKSGTLNSISNNTIENYLFSFKKMLDDNQIDQNIYDKISDLLLARYKVSEKSQETLTKKKTPKIMNNDNSTAESFNVEGALVVEEVQPNTDTHLSRKNNKPQYQNREKPPEIKKKDNLADVTSNGSRSSPQDAQEYYVTGLKLINQLHKSIGVKYITRAANLGHSDAKKYLKDNNLEGKANYLLKPNKIDKTHQTRGIGKTESYLQSRKIEKPSDTHHNDKEDVPSKDKAKQDTMSVGLKISWSIIVMFFGLVFAGYFMEVIGFGILHGLLMIGIVLSLFYIWSKGR